MTALRCGTVVQAVASLPELAALNEALKAGASTPPLFGLT